MPRKKKNQNQTQSVRTLKNEFKFHKLRTPTHPPEFVSNPWYALTVRIQNTPSSVTIAVLDTAISTQLGIATGGSFGNLEYRLQTIHFWGALTPPTGTSYLNPVTLSVLDPISVAGGVSSILQVLTDYPDQVKRAAVGFKYSFPQQQAVISGGFGYPLCHVQGGGNGSIMYIRLFWRTQNINIQSNFDQESGASTPASWQNLPNPSAPVMSPGPSYNHCRGQLRQI